MWVLYPCLPPGSPLQLHAEAPLKNKSLARVPHATAPTQPHQPHFFHGFSQHQHRRGDTTLPRNKSKIHFGCSFARVIQVWEKSDVVWCQLAANVVQVETEV